MSKDTDTSLRKINSELYDALKAMVDHFGVLEDNPLLNQDAVAATRKAKSVLAKAKEQKS